MPALPRSCGLPFLVLLTLSACNHAPNSGSPRAPVTITPADSASGLPENAHDYRCPTDQMLIARFHLGDETRPTAYLCATGEQFGPVPIKNVRRSSSFSESSGYRFVCEPGEVMVGRGHSGDEHGPTWYYCGTPHDYWNNPMQVVHEARWTGIGNEELAGEFRCPRDHALVGRWHLHGSSGPTEYLCAMLY